MTVLSKTSVMAILFTNFAMSAMSARLPWSENVLGVSHIVLRVITQLRVIPKTTRLAEMQLNVSHVLVIHLRVVAHILTILGLILGSHG